MSSDKKTSGCGIECNFVQFDDGDGDVVYCGEYLIRKSNREKVLQLCPDCKASNKQMEISDLRSEHCLVNSQCKHPQSKIGNVNIDSSNRTSPTLRVEDVKESNK